MDVDSVFIEARGGRGGPRRGGGGGGFGRAGPRFGGRSARGFRRPLRGLLGGGRHGFFRRFRDYRYPLWVYYDAFGLPHYYPWWYAYTAGLMTRTAYLAALNAYGGLPPGVVAPIAPAPGVVVDPVIQFGGGVMIAQQMPMQCQVCGKEENADENEPIGLHYCGACEGALYCGAKCQEADWAHHKEHECEVRE